MLGCRLIKKLAVGQPVGLNELVPWVRQLTPQGQSASLYRVQPANHFHTESDATAPLEVSRRMTSARPHDGCVTVAWRLLYVTVT